MPLPDERPFQTVANLIGRFEQQNKRQSSSASSVIPRSSSVSSQITTDPVKEESKEKREWPPKSVPSASTDKIPLTPSPSSSSSVTQSKSPIINPQPIPEKRAEIVTPAAPASPEPVEPTAVQIPEKATPSSGSRINPTSPPKPRPSTASIKSPAKSRSKSSLSSSISQPLKPQHTGHSVASNTSTLRSPPKSVPKSIPRSTPATPSRPKTPAVHPSRPKTPSSGLFAPTAASLARSRNVMPPAPLPVKKVTISSSAAERLSKPTAASMLRARTPSSTSSPVRSVNSTSAAPTPRGPSKLKVGLVPARMKATKAQPPATLVTTNNVELEQLVSGHAQNGYHPEEVVVFEGAIDLHDDDVHDHIDEVPAVDDGLSEVLSNPDAPHVEIPVDVSPDHVEALVEELVADGSIDCNGSDIAPATEEIVCGVVPDLAAVETEIEDMVIMLESVSMQKQRPQSIASIPDEHGEIPDEDQS